MAFLEMYLNGEWKNLSSFGTVSSVDIQSSSSAISVTGSPITSVGIINLSFNPSAIRLDQFAVPTSNLDINNKNLINVATPTLSHHATNKSYVDSKTWTSSSITDFSTSVTSIAKLITLDQFAVPMASLSMNNYRITSVSDPVNPQDVATKAFVQASIPTISVTGAVIGTINSQGVINTSLSQYIPISGSFINFNWPDMGSYSSPYSLYNYLPNADPAPIFNISSQTGSGATNSLRRWSMQFSQGSATSIGYEFALSFYHSLIVGDHTVTPLRIVYSIPDDQPRMYLKAILDMYNYKIVNVPNPTASDHAANKGYIDSKTWTSSSITDFSTASTTAAKTISLDQFAIPAANLNLNNKNITNLATPTLSNHAADKYYVDSRRISDFNSPITDISMNTNKIINLASPTLSGDAVNKNYVDTRSVNELAAPISAFSMNNNRITSVANPISAGDVATKNYVDAKPDPASIYYCRYAENSTFNFLNQNSWVTIDFVNWFTSSRNKDASFISFDGGGTFTVTSTGLYKIDVAGRVNDGGTASVSSTAASVFRNNAIVLENWTAVDSSVRRNFGVSCLVSINANDIIHIKIMQLGSSTNLSVAHITLSIIKLT